MALMDEVGVARTVILSGATGAAFDEAHQKYSKFGDRFELWCGIDFSDAAKPGFGPAAVKELERCYRLGATGVGELSDKGRGLAFRRTKTAGLHPDDPRMDPIFHKCAELGMPVNRHVADPIWMYEPMDVTNDGLMNALKWRLDNQAGIVGHAGMMEILERMARNSPGRRGNIPAG